jgi:hypothetical protein
MPLASRWILPSAGAVPAAPAYAGEASKVGGDRPPGLPLMGGDASLGLRYFSLQQRDGFLRLADRTSHLADRKPGTFQRLDRVTVLPELNPVPGDVAVAVGDHAAAPRPERAQTNAMQGRLRMRIR